MRENLLEFNIGREFGALKGLTPLLLETLFLGTNLLEFSIGSDIWALKGVNTSPTKLIWRKIELLPDEKSHGLEVHNEHHAKKYGLFPTIIFSSEVLQFGSLTPSISETLFGRQIYLKVV